MNKEEKMNKCQKFFNELADLLKDKYEIVGSCNQDLSAYLIPMGTVEEISYNGKPAYSFRISDHWNWYANTNKCENERYIQCWSVDLPYPRKRIEPGRASKPRFACQVAFIGANGDTYHAIFGEVWNRKTKTWEWLERSPSEVLALV